MPSTPLLIGLTVQYPSGTNLTNVNVTATNEGTSESQTLTSNSSGEVIFNLGSNQNFPDGWSPGDKISIVSIYTGFQQSFSFTIPSSGTTPVIDDSGATVGDFIAGQGMNNGTLVLVAVPSLPSLRYFTAQDYLDYFNLKTKDEDAENGISLLQLRKIGQSVEEDIDRDSRTKFDDNNGSYYSPSDFGDEYESPEYHDVLSMNQTNYYTIFTPINSVTTFEVNENAEGTTPSWDALTEAGNEINVNKRTGRIKIVDSGEYPEVGAGHVRITYTFGRANTPKDIKMLAVIETGLQMFGFNFIKDKIKEIDDSDIGDISSFQQYRQKIINRYKNPLIGSS